MQFSITASITPQFDSKIIYHETIEKDWMIFQSEAYSLGEKMLAYMRNYIADNSKRSGKTGNLIQAIKLYGQAGAGTAQIWWGIGHIPELNSIAKYWTLLNFGGMSWAGLTGKAVPGSFDGHAPDFNMAGTGVGNERFTHSPYIKNEHGKEGNYFMHVHSPIKGINYIESTTLMLDNELQNLIKVIKSGV
jgi:hypothetical protein